MKWFHQYISSFKDLQREVWFLAFVTFINRAGTMVIPFLSLYLKTKQFNYTDIGWIMSAFGLGSMCGAWLGGKLTSKIGFYTVMYLSLLSSGIGFIALQYMDGIIQFSCCVFLVMVLADGFRPASYVAIQHYSKEENRTRSLSLLRLAINIGFSLGPAIGGYLIAKQGFSALFWVDGITCMLAGIAFLSLLKPIHFAQKNTDENQQKVQSPYTDKSYLLLIFCVFLIGFTFLQYFSTVPLYYKEIHLLSEGQIGLLFFMNGMIIGLVEMPIVKYIERKAIALQKVIVFSLILLSFSFLVLNLIPFQWVLTLGILLMTFGEIFNFPFLNTLAMNKAKGANMGDYMALFTMAFSLAHILGHNSGMQLIKLVNYTYTWYIMSAILGLALFLILVYFKRIKNETNV